MQRPRLERPRYLKSLASLVFQERQTVSATQSTDPSASIIDQLNAELGSGQVTTGARLKERSFTDWSGTPAGLPLALVLPRTPEEVAATLRICTMYRHPVSVQGGLTGLAGGAAALDGEVVLSLERLNTIEDLDALGGTAVVQAGVTLERLQAAAAEAGWFFPVDLGARGSCQIGGNAATNAGGNRVLRFGMMREAILGLEVALVDGTVLTMLDRVIKNNAGYDLKHLFIGSEGTLGVITRLAVKLFPNPNASVTVLCPVPDFAAAAALLREARGWLPELAAFELMWPEYLAATAQAQQRAHPFTEAHPLYVLMEALGADATANLSTVENFLERALNFGWVSDAIVAQSGEQAKQLWDLREGVSELLPSMHPFAAFDVSVALPRMEALVGELRTRLELQFPAQRHLFFGHLGDGNLHLLSGRYESELHLEEVEHIVYQAVARAEGSISAEHGIGVVKRPFLRYSRDPAQIHVMQQLKGTLDPHRILNPGRVLPAGEDAGQR